MTRHPGQRGEEEEEGEEKEEEGKEERRVYVIKLVEGEGRGRLAGEQAGTRVSGY